MGFITDTSDKSSPILSPSGMSGSVEEPQGYGV